ncbi:MAG: sulfite exporter TauE/SafE family protein [Sulfurifustis sp.]
MIDPVSFESLAIAALVVTCGYFVFGLSGFGSALVTVPVVSHLWPVQFVLPVLALLDVSAGMYLGVRHHEQAERGELTRMIPLAFIGAVIGVALLVDLPRDASMAGVGGFALLYGLYTLVEKGTPRMVGRQWAYVSGVTGGAIGALFGIGGPAYVIYLSRRIHDKSVLRATIATMVIFSVASRLVIFAFAGLLGRNEIMTALFLLPFAFAGIWAGGHVHLRVSREQLGRVISALLIATGISLLMRAVVS